MMDSLFSVTTIIFFLLSLLFYVMAYFILKKQAYFLISGFNTRPEDEQKELIRRGSPQATGKMMLFTGILLTIGLILHLLKLPHALDVALIVMIVAIFGGFIYIQRYELPEKRRKGYVISGLTTAITIISITIIMMNGFSGNDVTIMNGNIQISGIYGEEWPIDAIEEVIVLETMPNIERRTNGFSIFDFHKGHFTVEDLGKGKLFIQGKQPPYLLIQMKDTFVIINGKNSDDVQSWVKMIEEGRSSF